MSPSGVIRSVCALFLAVPIVAGCGSLPLGAAPTVTVTKTVRATVTIQERITVTPSPVPPPETEEPQIEMGPPEEDGFFMPDLVGTEATTAYDFLWYEYGLSEGLGGFEVKQGTYCEDWEVAVVQQIIPSAGTWVPFSESGDAVTLYVACV